MNEVRKQPSGIRLGRSIWTMEAIALSASRYSFGYEMSKTM